MLQPVEVNGVETEADRGVSMVYSFDDPQAPVTATSSISRCSGTGRFTEERLVANGPRHGGSLG